MKLKVATYNIKHASTNGRYIAEIAKLIKDNNLDIVGIQELDLNITRSGKQDVLAEIAQKAGYPYYHFFKTIDYQDGEYGIGILSKHLLSNLEFYPLKEATEARVLGKAKVTIENKEIYFLVTHLDLGTYQDVRRYQFEEVAEVVNKLDTFILTGDFNVHDWTDKLNDFFEYEEYLGKYNLANNKTNTFLTFSGKEDIGTGILPLDNIITSNNIKINNAYIIDTHYSDHDILIAEIEI
mgnify:CR=1 FL=1